MSDSLLDSLLEQFDITLSQSQRLLRLALPGTALLPHRLVGEERVSTPFRYRLDCVAQQGDIELTSLMAQPAQLSVLQADGSTRTRHALVEEAALLGEDGGVYYYQLTLVPWLAMLKLGRDSRLFQGRSAVDILTEVFDGHPIARGGYRFDLRREYPPRSYCVQYRESDFNFISRLCEEEGLWYYFEHAGDGVSDDDGGDNSVAFDGHRLVITDDVDTCPPVSPQAIRFHRQAATETEDALNQWGAARRAQPTRVSVGTFDYKQPALTKRTGLDTLDEQGNLPASEVYDYAGEYYYHGFERGERLTENRLEAHESLARRFHGAGGARQLQAGHWFELTQHPLHDTGGEAERQFLLLGITTHAENALPVSAHLKRLPGSLQAEMDAARRAHGLDEDQDDNLEVLDNYRSAGTGHFLVDIEAQRRSQPYRHPLTHRRPVLGGPQTATVVGPAGEEIHTDHLNRVRVQFHWDRQGQRNEQAGVWLRVAQPSAGGGWGGVFVPRVGQEVLVDFLEGDADRPLITGRIYNGEQTPDWHSNGLLSGIKSKTYRGSKYNELVFDDATDQERVRLNSEHSKSQLNLGYLIHQNGNHRGTFRGTGFELRTDAYGAIRANEGLYLSSWGQLGASGDQLDLSPARDQIQSAWNLSDTLSQSAADHNAEPFDTLEGLKQAGDDADDRYGNSEQIADADQNSARGASESGGRGESARMKAPWLHMASPAGITMSTPESTHLAQGRSLSVSTGEDMSIATGRSLIASISEKLSLFVYRAGIKLFAAKGKVEVQAQSDDMALTAQKDVKITSTEGRVQINAANGILLSSGGGYIRIEGGNVEIHGPGNIDVKGAQHVFDGPASMDMAMPELPEGSDCQTKHAGAASKGSSFVG
ncbi:type VI secretion system Vgr family protein [Larsenimonas rhizosphaerae]|uniref:Type VI secretion system tip protein TssI/VgrG n=1 Tax=Larsenimonas rhizosphaerae TaxID=2944682 RepID=A0AA41ZK89_9GAMM|nr:type VI secretion system Vgr family protein [Larsenimonas rhizosphaerae]MCM2130777.1 type VI secretion system tip protein VgrG [Larsenimonas rhizosphaerae]MCX2523481.1 type VI secretion system tip protein TssI/VgrG [Larsenimonas rhizosphaerae]